MNVGGTGGSNGANGTVQRLKCIKYLLMVVNSFGVLLGFFIVLFGFAYPDAGFPGGYSGRETAMFAGVFIFFSLIGYCGAAHQKNLFLIPYAVVIFCAMIYNFFGCSDPKSLSLGGLLILLLTLASLLIYKIKRATIAAATAAASEESMEKRSTTRSTSSFIAISKFPGKK